MDCHSLATSPIELLDALTLIAFLEDPKLIDGISELLDRSPSPQPNTKDQEVHKDEEADGKGTWPAANKPGDLWGVGARRRCAVHPQVGSSRQYECGKAMPKSALDGVDDVKEGYKQGNKPHKERYRQPGWQPDPQGLSVCAAELLPHKEDGRDIKGICYTLVDDHEHN